MIKKVIHDYFKQNKVLLIGYLLLLLIGLTNSFVLLPKYSSEVINNIGNKKETARLLLIVSVALTFAIFTDLLRRWLEDTIVPDFSRFTRKEIYKIVMNSHQSDNPVEVGKLLNTMSYLPVVIRSVTIELVKHYLPHVIALFLLVGYFFYLDTKIGVLKLITVLIFLLIIYINSKSCINAAYHSQKNFMTLSEDIKDKVANISSIFATHQEDNEVKEYEKDNKANAEIHKFSLRKIWKLRCYEEILIIISFIFFNLIVIRSKYSKSKLISLFVAELYYFLRMIQAAQANMVGLFGNIGESKAMLEYLVGEIMLTNNKYNNYSNKLSLNKPSLEIKNMSFRYDDKAPWIFKDINYTLKKGDRVFIKGKSGCGKSTLFKLILGSLKPVNGDIRLYGSSNTNLIRDNISIVDQHSKLFNDTIFNNIKYSNNATEEDVENVLKKLGTNIFEKLPDGIHTNVGVDSSSMSGGQRQLIILLRVYFRNAKVILMDEPVASVDTGNLPLILNMIDYMSKDKTLLIISHNDIVSKITNKVIKLC
tara:strand:- start:56 stop:1660 length:1605 start_codon:yes stop_codon:yes gene_type:complete